MNNNVDEIQKLDIGLCTYGVSGSLGVERIAVMTKDSLPLDFRWFL